MFVEVIQNGNRHIVEISEDAVIIAGATACVWEKRKSRMMLSSFVHP